MNNLVKGIILIIVAAVVVVGVMYFTSDVQKTRIDAAYDQYAKWTPENIAKDPENYLNFCQSEGEKALVSLKASEISIAQNRGNLDAMKKESTGKVAAGEKAIGELKALYSQAEQANTWPVAWQGQNREKEWVKRQIVSLNRQIQGQKTLLARIAEGVSRLDAQMVRVQEGRTQTQEQLTEIKTSREILKVEKLTNELTQRLVSIKSVLQATISTASESTGTISLDQLATQEATAIDETEFNTIMGN